MASKIKKSKERIEIIEKYVWGGLDAGIKATENKANASEILDVLLRIAQSINAANHKQNTSGNSGSDVIKMS